VNSEQTLTPKRQFKII